MHNMAHILRQLYLAGLMAGMHGMHGMSGGLSEQARQFWEQAMNTQQQSPAKPASEEAIRAMPVRKLSSDSEPLLGHNCAICQEKYAKEDHVIELPCKHNYHKDCCMPWLKERNTCPLCRANVDLKASKDSSNQANTNNSPSPMETEPNSNEPFPMEQEGQGSEEKASARVLPTIQEILPKLSVSVLKRLMNAHRITHNDCIEKHELVSRIMEKLTDSQIRSYLATESK